MSVDPFDAPLPEAPDPFADELPARAAMPVRVEVLRAASPVVVGKLLVEFGVGPALGLPFCRTTHGGLYDALAMAGAKAGIESGTTVEFVFSVPEPGVLRIEGGRPERKRGRG